MTGPAKIVLVEDEAFQRRVIAKFLAQRIVNTGAGTTGGIRTSKREPSKGASSGSSHSRIGFSRVTVLRRVHATVPMKDSADADGILLTGAMP